MRKLPLIPFGLLLFTAGAQAQSIEACKRITTDADRLGCFDKLPVPPKPAPKAAPKAAAPDPFAKAKIAISNTLKDPASAQFQNVVTSAMPNIICGEVNAKNSYGGYVGRKAFIYIVSEDLGIIIDGKGGNPDQVLRALNLFKGYCPGQILL